MKSLQYSIIFLLKVFYNEQLEEIKTWQNKMVWEGIHLIVIPI